MTLATVASLFSLHSHRVSAGILERVKYTLDIIYRNLQNETIIAGSSLLRVTGRHMEWREGSNTGMSAIFNRRSQKRWQHRRPIVEDR
ncbi:hypothetical protein BDN71DRAFT_9425 [Pleurotus eryngii]|uniref:Uncharacterized protein n=1 Tax=Pleurotus eryngii TaxID=5323 RepID=A0A9P6ABE4_PLEER|nr:hypothetical protein BDN71DRAFT_9425 [Pleurotus eryngii]